MIYFTKNTFDTVQFSKDPKIIFRTADKNFWSPCHGNLVMEKETDLRLLTKRAPNNCRTSETYFLLHPSPWPCLD